MFKYNNSQKNELILKTLKIFNMIKVYSNHLIRIFRMIKSYILIIIRFYFWILYNIIWHIMTISSNIKSNVIFYIYFPFMNYYIFNISIFKFLSLYNVRYSLLINDKQDLRFLRHKSRAHRTSVSRTDPIDHRRGTAHVPPQVFRVEPRFFFLYYFMSL